jgi:hypothetical protein
MDVPSRRVVVVVSFRFLVDVSQSSQSGTEMSVVFWNENRNHRNPKADPSRPVSHLAMVGLLIGCFQWIAYAQGSSCI